MATTSLQNYLGALQLGTNSTRGSKLESLSRPKLYPTSRRKSVIINVNEFQFRKVQI